MFQCIIEVYNALPMWHIFHEGFVLFEYTLKSQHKRQASIQYKKDKTIICSTSY